MQQIVSNKLYVLVSPYIAFMRIINTIAFACCASSQSL